MKILMSLSMLLLLSVSTSFGQAVTEVVTTKVEKVANCKPSPECAAKMGMTLEECKKLCVNPTAECASKMGMTLEECKKLCTKSSAETVNDGETKVAAASFATEIESTDANTAKANTLVKEKACAKGSKACCKKKS